MGVRRSRPHACKHPQEPHHFPETISGSLPCCVRRPQSPEASRCLLCGPFAPCAGSGGNAGSAGPRWRRCCLGYLPTPPPLMLSALLCLKSRGKHKVRLNEREVEICFSYNSVRSDQHCKQIYVFFFTFTNFRHFGFSYKFQI